MATNQTTSSGLWPRGALTRFVKRHELAWDLGMGVLTVVYVTLAFTEDSAIGVFDSYGIWVLAGIFLLEFLARCYDSADRRRYLTSHWLDLITAIPIPGIPGLRVIRLLRLLRFMKVGVLIRRTLLGRGWNEGNLIWPTLFLFWIGSALALWLVEHDAQGTTINTFPEAMTAAFLTAATLGFGKHALPVTQDGQIIAAVIVFFALGLWGFASGDLTRRWLNTQEKHASDSLRHELDVISEQLKHLTLLIERKLNSTGPEEHSAADEPEYTRP
jgi:voltage-gated potassium channel